MLRVLVVDDRVDLRQTFAALIEGQPDLEVLGEAGSLAEARTMLDGVDVAFLDRGLHDGDGLKLMWPLREANPDARVLVMSATAEIRHPEDAMEAGADGVVDKFAPFELMFAAIRGQGATRAPTLGLRSEVRGTTILGSPRSNGCRKDHSFA